MSCALSASAHDRRYEFAIIILALVFALAGHLKGSAYWLNGFLAINTALIIQRATVRITREWHVEWAPPRPSCIGPAPSTGTWCRQSSRPLWTPYLSLVGRVPDPGRDT